jgi:hypothetical protein
MRHRHNPNWIAAASVLTAIALAPVVFADSPEATAPATVPSTTLPTTTTAHVATTTTQVVTTTSTTTTTTTIPAGDWSCPDWLTLAIEVGFAVDELPIVDRLIFRESRCQPDAYNGDDPNGGSRGLMQINGIWCEWYLQSLDIVDTCDQLYDPATNLRAALAIRNRQGGYGAWGL